MGVFRDFRRVADALERVAATITAASKGSEDRSVLTERLNELERDRTMWEADVEALLMKAEGKLQAANNAESRTRTMKKAYEKRQLDLDPFDLDSDEVPATVHEGDVPAGEETGMLEMPLALETNSKTHALKAKWGL